MKWDFFNGEDRDELVRRTLRRTLAELEQDYGTADMAQWLHAVGQRRFATYDPSIYWAVKLGHIPEAVPMNGMPSWTTVMEIGEEPPRMLTAIPSGGQSRFINPAGEAGSHISDQVSRHLEHDLKTVWLDRSRVLADAESTTVLELPCG